MTRKINFTVICATSEDPNYRATELNVHGPAVKGWQSAKNCEYPQEIILKLEAKCLVMKIQILAHQYLIPSKVEFFVCKEDVNSTLSSTTWEYIGYITLSDNESTGFESRELKSANVPSVIASLVKFRLGRNYSNCHNNDNQVSIIGVNVLGRVIDLGDESNGEDDMADKLNDPEYLSPYDDLAFQMYTDTDIIKILKKMEYKKFLAIKDERYEYARKLKEAMEKLKSAGEKLGKYELEKHHAITAEDYERARCKKNQIEAFKSEIYEEVCVDQLLETNGTCPKNDRPYEASYYSKSNELHVDERIPNGTNSHLSPKHRPRCESAKTVSPKIGSPTSLQQRGSFRRRNKSAGAISKTCYEMYEDKPLPALRHSQTSEFLRECHAESEFKMTSKLSDREKKQAALPIMVFGINLVEKFYSKHYCDKEEGLLELKDELLNYDNRNIHTPNKIARATIFLLHRALRDKVFSVYNLANELIRLFFVQFAPNRISSAEVARSVDKLLPELLIKSGDTSSRIHHMAVHTILTMADCENVRELNVIPVHLSRPISTTTHPRLALSRAEMVEQLIINYGISTNKQSGLTCRTLAEFGASGLHHPAEAVRKVSERILVLVYKVNPRMVRKQLPPDDDITRRNLLYRQLFQEFDIIDFERRRELLEKSQANATQRNHSVVDNTPVHNDIDSHKSI